MTEFGKFEPGEAANWKAPRNDQVEGSEDSEDQTANPDHRALPREVSNEGDSHDTSAQPVEQADKVESLERQVDRSVNSAKEAIKSLESTRNLAGAVTRKIIALCRQEATDVRGRVDRLTELGAPTDTLGKVTVLSELFSELAGGKEVTNLLSSIEEEAAQRLYPLQLDMSKLNSPSGEEASQFALRLVAENDKLIDQCARQRTSLMLRVRNLLNKVTGLAQALHVNDNVIPGESDKFDTMLRDGLDIHKIDIKPGMPITNELASCITPARTIDTDDNSRSGRIAAVIEEGYSLGRALNLGNEQFGDVVQRAAVAIFGRI